MEGRLHKKVKIIHGKTVRSSNWEPINVVLDDEMLKFSQAKGQKATELLSLTNALVAIAKNKKPNVFELKTPNSVHLFHADNMKDFVNWIQQIQNVIDAASSKPAAAAAVATGDSSLKLPSASKKRRTSIVKEPEPQDKVAMERLPSEGIRMLGDKAVCKIIFCFEGQESKKSVIITPDQTSWDVISKVCKGCPREEEYCLLTIDDDQVVAFQMDELVFPWIEQDLSMQLYVSIFDEFKKPSSTPTLSTSTSSPAISTSTAGSAAAFVPLRVEYIEEDNTKIQKVVKLTDETKASDIIEQVTRGINSQSFSLFIEKEELNGSMMVFPVYQKQDPNCKVVIRKSENIKAPIAPPMSPKPPANKLPVMPKPPAPKSPMIPPTGLRKSPSGGNHSPIGSASVSRTPSGNAMNKSPSGKNFDSDLAAALGNRLNRQNSGNNNSQASPTLSPKPSTGVKPPRSPVPAQPIPSPGRNFGPKVNVANKPSTSPKPPISAKPSASPPVAPKKPTPASKPKPPGKKSSIPSIPSPYSGRSPTPAQPFSKDKVVVKFPPKTSSISSTASNSFPDLPPVDDDMPSVDDDIPPVDDFDLPPPIEDEIPPPIDDVPDFDSLDDDNSIPSTITTSQFGAYDSTAPPARKKPEAKDDNLVVEMPHVRRPSAAIDMSAEFTLDDLGFDIGLEDKDACTFDDLDDDFDF
eukprot:Awhi_evm1s15013